MSDDIKVTLVEDRKWLALKFGDDVVHNIEVAVGAGHSPEPLIESLRRVRAAIDHRLDQLAPVEPPEPGGCLTVGNLRSYLEGFPEHGEVWLGDGNGRSNECVSICRLNHRPLDGTCDVLLEPREQ